MTTFRELLELFLAGTQGNLSASSLEFYRNTLAAEPRAHRNRRPAAQGFAIWADAQGIAPTALTRAHVRSFYETVRQRGVSDQSVAKHARAMRRFLFWLAEEGHDVPSLAPWRAANGLMPRVASRPPKSLAADERQRLEAYLSGKRPGRHGPERRLRDLVLFELGVFSALRRGEMVRLRWGMIRANAVGQSADSRQGEGMGYAEVEQKGGSTRRVRFRAKTMQQLATYGNYVPQNEHDPVLWTTPRGRNGQRRPLSGLGITRIVNGWGQAIGIRLHPHVLRHTAAFAMLDAGIPVTAAAQLMGHRQVATTLHYAQMREKEADDYFGKAFG